MTHHELNQLFTQHNTTSKAFTDFCLSHGVFIDGSTVSKQRSGAIGIGLFAQVAYGCFFSQCQNKKSEQ